MYKLLKILTFVTCLMNFVNSQLGNTTQNSFTVKSNFVVTEKNNFVGNRELQIGNVMQCKLDKIISNKTVLNNDLNGDIRNIQQGIRIDTSGYEQAYKFYGVENGTKCASFQVRAEQNVYLALSSVESNMAPIIEIVIGDNGNTIIRHRTNQNQIPLAQASTPTFLNATGFRGFWIRWTDDHLLEVGRESDLRPFIQYRSMSPLLVLYLGIQTWSVPGSWNLYGNRKCPGFINKSNTEQHVKVESKCWWVPVNGTHNNQNSTIDMKLQNHQLNIYNQLKVEFDIYNAITKRTRALSNRILVEIEEQFRKAKELQKIILGNDSTAKSTNFNSIIQLFYKFYELIQKDLLQCFQGCKH